MEPEVRDLNENSMQIVKRAIPLLVVSVILFGCRCQRAPIKHETSEDETTMQQPLANQGVVPASGDKNTISEKQTRLSKNQSMDSSSKEISDDQAMRPTYRVIDSSIMPGVKRSLDVQLNRKVSKDELRAIAIELKALDSRTYERTLICYYLPGMRVGSGAWATTHFNPDLKVEIQGLTTEEENALTQLPNDPSREVIGMWLDESLFGGGRLSIFRQEGKLFLETTAKDGSNWKKEMIERSSPRGRTFQRKEGSRVGEFYLIDMQGNLQVWDQDGLISTAKPVK